MQTFKQALLVVAVALFFASLCAFADDKPMAAPVATSAPAEEVPSTGIEISKMSLCKNVVERECDQEVTTGKVGEMVVGWTQIRSGLGEVTITHRWLHEDENMGDVPLVVRSSPYRTWSRKTLGAAGNWKWQVLNSSGAVLKELAFTVTQ